MAHKQFVCLQLTCVRMSLEYRHLSCDVILPFPYSLSTSILSGAGASRRLPSDLPPHIQQLLDQQERQGFDRSSPSRRPVYRKLLVGGPSGSSECLGRGLVGLMSVLLYVTITGFRGHFVPLQEQKDTHQSF